MQRLGKCILNYIDQLCCLTIFFCWHLSFVSGHLIWPSNGFHNLLLSSHSPEAEQPVNLQHTSYIYFWQNENEAYATHHRQSTSNWNPVTHEHLLPDTHTPPLNHQHYPGGIFHKQLNHSQFSTYPSVTVSEHWQSKALIQRITQAPTGARRQYQPPLPLAGDLFFRERRASTCKSQKPLIIHF